jgi:hypothetical protein
VEDVAIFVAARQNRLGLWVGFLGTASVLLSGCSTTDDAVFFALAGEKPGSRTQFVDAGNSVSLSKRPPLIAETRYRPALTPTGAAAGETADLVRTYTRARLLISDLDDNIFAQRRSLALYVEQYRTATRTFKLTPGDPLPTNDAAFKSRLTGARSALDDIDRDIRKLNGLVARLEKAMAPVRSLAEKLRPSAVSGAPTTLRAKLAKAASQNNRAASAMLNEGRKLIASYLVYVSGQRDALKMLEAQVVSAKGKSERGIFEKVVSRPSIFK